MTLDPLPVHHFSGGLTSGAFHGRELESFRVICRYAHNALILIEITPGTRETLSESIAFKGKSPYYRGVIPLTAPG
jgi:hypothetical protein